MMLLTDTLLHLPPVNNNRRTNSRSMHNLLIYNYLFNMNASSIFHGILRIACYCNSLNADGLMPVCALKNLEKLA